MVTPGPAPLSTGRSRAVAAVERTGFLGDVSEACFGDVDGLELPASHGPVGVVAGGDSGGGPQRSPTPGVQRLLSLVLQVGAGAGAGAGAGWMSTDKIM